MLPSMSVAPQAGAAIVCVAICLAGAMWRSICRKHHLKRIENLNKAAELLESHARHLERFLDDPNAPRALKTMLMHFSEAMADREAVCEWVSWMSRQPIELPNQDEATKDVVTLVEKMRREQPQLAQAFSSATVCGAFAAILRWPESAAHFDQSGPVMVADANQEIAVAVHAARMKHRPLFDVDELSPQHAIAC